MKQEGCDEPGEEIFVKSFTNENTKYTISLSEEDLISSCTCEYMSTNFSACKHMYLASRTLGYSKFFDIRRTYKLEIDLELFSQLNLEGSDQEIFAADFCQVLKLVDPVIIDYDKLENQDQSLCQEVLPTSRVLRNQSHFLNIIRGIEQL